MNLIDYLVTHIEWSKKVFGTADRAEGICKHIESELQEIRENPSDVEEWCDVIILALDGAWRQGYSPEEICAALEAKQNTNKKRTWATVRNDEAAHHTNTEVGDLK